MTSPTTVEVLKKARARPALEYGDDIAHTPHRLKVVGYSDIYGAHRCKADGFDREVFVDLFVNGDFPEDFRPEDLIGKDVDVDYTHGFIWLAASVRLVEPRAIALASEKEAGHVG